MPNTPIEGLRGARSFGHHGKCPFCDGPVCLSGGTKGCMDCGRTEASVRDDALDRILPLLDKLATAYEARNQATDDDWLDKEAAILDAVEDLCEPKGD